MLDFEDKTITLYDKYVNTPIIPEVWPEPDVSLTTTVEMNVTDKIIYSGNMSVGFDNVGDGKQGSAEISYNTRLTYSMVPSSVTSFGWFDTTGYDGYIDSGNSWVADLGYWSADCNNMTVDVCIDGDLCVENLELCLIMVAAETPPESTYGVIGLGKPTSILAPEQQDCFMQELYIQSNFTPMVTFKYFFAEDSEQSSVIFGYPPTRDLDLIANVNTYEDYANIVKNGEWALQVAGASWGYFPVDESSAYSNDVAIIASAYDFIALPSIFY